MEPISLQRSSSNLDVDNGEKKDDVFQVDVLDVNHSAEVNDPVFGIVSNTTPYRHLGFLQATVLLVKSQIGLGVLAVPYIMATLGAIPGVITVVAVAIMTTWTDYYVGVFKHNHPEIYSFSDAGFVLAGPWGREILGWMTWLYMTVCVGSGFLGLSIGLNAITLHATCTAIWQVCCFILTTSLACIQDIRRIAWLAWVGFAGIMIALVGLAIGVGVEDRPGLAPKTGPWDKNIELVASPTFVDAMVAISTAVFVFAGTPGFFPIVAEMRRPQDYKKAVLTCQAIVTSTYLVIGIVVYYYCGQYVASPALGSAGPVLKRVLYGFGVVALLASSILYIHLAAKLAMVRILRGSKHLTSNSKTHWVTWIGLCWLSGFFSFITSTTIPVFSGLVGLIGALFATFLSLQAFAWMWFFDNWRGGVSGRTVKFYLMAAFNILIFVFGMVVMVAGAYGSVVQIKQSYEAGGGTSAFSCADNS